MTDEEKLKKAFDIYENFERDLDDIKKYNKSYAQLMWEIMENEEAIYYSPTGKRTMIYIRDRNRFAEVTGLGPSTYDRIKRDKFDWVPGIRTFMTLCMIYQLNITMVRALRHSYGYDFNPQNQLHQAYVYLLVNCRGKSLSYCNKVLKALKIDKKHYLGDGTIDEGIAEAEALEDI